MSRLYLVRHGPTHAKCFVGWTDLPADLSDHTTISRLEAALPDAPVVSSDLSRAVETANRLQAHRPRLPHDPRLRETNFGAWEGLTWDEVCARDPELTRPYFEAPGDTCAPQGESWNMLGARVFEAVSAHMNAQPARDLIVVAHMGVIMSLIHKALNGPASQATAYEIAPLSLTVIHCDGQPAHGEWHLERVNHFPDADVM